jgi:CRP-like cAMP-binding protein
MPKEPELICQIFRQFGHVRTFDRGELIPHGGSEGLVFLLQQGVVTFGYYDRSIRHQVFDVVLPGRTVGDLESLDGSTYPIIARCIRPVRSLAVGREVWVDRLRSSVDIMQAYAQSANCKHRCTMEGMICNYTLPLEERLRKFFHALITAHYSIKEEGWNPCPVALTVTEVSRIVACNRSWVSRSISSWIASGLAKKDGRMLLISSRLFFRSEHDSDPAGGA